jgi:predicted O-methyltransferase YrrM
VISEELYADPPQVHVDDSGRAHGDWALSTAALRAIERMVQPGDRTLETGLGVSTALFALLGTEHTAIAPHVDEVRRLRAYCADRGIGLDRVTFEHGWSQHVLPALAIEALDLVLLDGSHAFPIPFLDWFYTAGLLREGGVLVVDDTQLWTGRVLHDFLLAEEGWRHEASPEHATVFRKTKPFDAAVSWVRQPYVTLRSLVWSGTAWRPFHPDEAFIAERAE